MTKILHIDSSLFSSKGVSSALAAEFIEDLRRRDPSLRVQHRDLGRDPIPHLDGQRLGAIATSPDDRTPEQAAIADEAERLVRELQEADLLVLGVPMYNFGIPSQLKSWLDHVARAGVTFRYTAEGPVGLLKDKRAVIFTSRGGLHRGQSTDSQTPYLETILGFLGITDVRIIYAEGLNMAEPVRSEGLAAAESEARELAVAWG